MVTALQTEVTEGATIDKTLMEAKMNLMPSLVFQISYSETPKMFLGNFLEDGTRLKTFLIPLAFLAAVVKDQPDLECITNLRIIIQLTISSTKLAQIMPWQIRSDHLLPILV